MHLQLIEKTQTLVDEDEVDGNCLEGEKDCEWHCFRHMDTYNDEQTMMVLNGG